MMILAGHDLSLEYDRVISSCPSAKYFTAEAPTSQEAFTAMAVNGIQPSHIEPNTCLYCGYLNLSTSGLGTWRLSIGGRECSNCGGD